MNATRPHRWLVHIGSGNGLATWTSHYLSQCWPRSIPYDVTRLQWAKTLNSLCMKCRSKALGQNFFFSKPASFPVRLAIFSYSHIWCSNYVWVIPGRFNGSIAQLQWVQGKRIWCQSKLIMIVNPISLLFNSLWLSNAIRWHESGSTVAQVMACCLTAPSHYQTQRWLIISEIFWHSPEGNLTWNAQDI